ncbi:MAG: DUF3997 domain-containing protein [Anaerolineae bacterium]|nr:DUF3997 domain-containing protein [Anaerolineae bacterium]
MKRQQCYTIGALLVALLLSLACGGIGLAYEYDLTGDYAVWAPDQLVQAAVVQKIPESSSGTVVIPSMVVAYGWNDDFIIAQRYPDGDVSMTEWYILVVAEGAVHGPFDAAEFAQARQDLGVPPMLDFSQTITP